MTIGCSAPPSRCIRPVTDCTLLNDCTALPNSMPLTSDTANAPSKFVALKQPTSALFICAPPQLECTSSRSPCPFISAKWPYTIRMPSRSASCNAASDDGFALFSFALSPACGGRSEEHTSELQSQFHL